VQNVKTKNRIILKKRLSAKAGVSLRDGVNLNLMKASKVHTLSRNAGPPVTPLLAPNLSQLTSAMLTHLATAKMLAIAGMTLATKK
jgi:hypothetical protein